MSRTGTALLLAAAVVVGGACGDDDSDLTVGPAEDLGEAEGAWPGDDSDAEARDFDLGRGLVVELPVSWEVEPFEIPDHDAGGSEEETCQGPEATLGPAGPGASFRLALHPAGCGSDTRIINGFHGTYTTLDDVPEPENVEETTVVAGALTTFTQRYVEYTNERNVYEDHVGLLALDTPPDPEHPTVMILDPKGEFSMADLVAVAEAIDVNPGA